MPKLQIILPIPDDWTAEMAQTLANRLEGELPSEIEPKIVTVDKSFTTDERATT